MAKSIAYYYNQIIDIKHTQSQLTSQLTPVGDSSVENLSTLLAQLNSSSKVAIWRLWAWIVATFAWTVDVDFDKTKAELQYIADTIRAGTDLWLVDAAKDFRYNTTTNNMVPLIVDPITKKSTYASDVLGVDEVKPIAVASVIKSNSGFTNILVAKVSGLTFEKLNTNELQAFKDYMASYKQYSGTNIQVNSQDGDILSYNLQVRFDFTKGTANPVAAIKTAIETACKNIKFNGKLERLTIEDEIQKVQGVLGITGIYQGKGASASSYINFQDYYQTISGYINPSTTIGETEITLLPNE